MGCTSLTLPREAKIYLKGVSVVIYYLKKIIIKAVLSKQSRRETSRRWRSLSDGKWIAGTRSAASQGARAQFSAPRRWCRGPAPSLPVGLSSALSLRESPQRGFALCAQPRVSQEAGAARPRLELSLRLRR